MRRTEIREFCLSGVVKANELSPMRLRRETSFRTVSLGRLNWARRRNASRRTRCRLAFR